MNYIDGTVLPFSCLVSAPDFALKVYEGMWENGKRHGAGTLFLANGDVYQVRQGGQQEGGHGWLMELRVTTPWT